MAEEKDVTLNEPQTEDELFEQEFLALSEETEEEKPAEEKSEEEKPAEEPEKEEKEDSKPPETPESEEKKAETPVEMAVEDARLRELKREAEEWKHKYQSDAGRVSALQRKLDKATEDLEKLMGKQDAPSSQEVADAKQDDDTWKEFKTNYPDIAKAFDGRVKTFEKIIAEQDKLIKAQLEPLAEKVQTHDETIEEQTTKLDRSTEIAVLEAPLDKGGYGFADWEEISASSEFQTWITRQHESVKSLLGSAKAADAAYVLQLYQDLNKPTTNAEEKDDSKEVEEKRQRALESNVDLKGTGGGPSATAPSDYDSAFQFFVSQDEKNKRN